MEPNFRSYFVALSREIVSNRRSQETPDSQQQQIHRPQLQLVGHKNAATESS
jgi:hypothetical protein